MNLHPDSSRSTMPRGGLRSLVHLAGRFRADRSGATAVLAILLMPIMVLAFWGGFSVWKVIQIRESLHHGTYNAARFLSFYAPEDPAEDLWSSIATKIVVQELLNNPYTAKEGGAISTVDLNVSVTLTNGTRECSDKFVVTSKYTVRVLPVGSSQENNALPNFDLINLDDVRDGEVLCE